MNEPTIGLYPGSFDPPTNGHMDIIRRALRLVPQLIVAVAVNKDKKALFSIEERVELLSRALKEGLPPELFARIEVTSFTGLVVEFAKEHKARVLIRGLRMVSDFEYEFQMAGMNRLLAPEIETVVLMTDEANAYVSSRTVKEVATFGGSVAACVPRVVVAALNDKLKP